jgi:hypothetical protein
LSEVRWSGKGKIVSENYTVFYSTRVMTEKLFRIDIVKHVTKVECYRDRLMFVKISAKPVDIMIVQVYEYIPTMDYDDVKIGKNVQDQ